MCERRPLWKRRERALLYLSHLKCARQLIVTNHIRESGGEQVTATRVYARARPGIYACGSGREVPSFGWFFVSCITRAHVHTHTRTPTSASVSEKNVHAAADASVRAYVYIAPLECVPGVWIRRPPEIGWCKKEKRKLSAPISFCRSQSTPLLSERSRIAKRAVQLSMALYATIAYMLYDIFLSRSP